MLSGRLTLALESGPHVVAPGRSAVIASDQQYACRNDGSAPVVFMRVVTGA
ncbi:hypothetical protein [Streptomyces sp. IMTB 2501]|uniref:hypothetical protein n=1 Tax=Streptomyces sp. IMTB 2501 TaxID=1776340 RepID=UPI0015BA2992|nr:hypothetical protein [Streptomyces sp. IMTB 2501]